MIKTSRLCFEYLLYDEDTNQHVGLQALQNIDISIQKGEFIAILGANGSGKSTLAKHMNALLRPTEGTIWVNGCDTNDEALLWDVRQSAGMVFQNPDNQIIATIVEEDVAFGPENLGIAPDEIRRRVDSVLNAVSMTEYAASPPHFLSGGQKQRISIAGVLAMKPDCIVLDEPTAMLDPKGRREVIDTVTRLNKEENITVILITHFMDEAIKADRVIVMDNGRVAMDAPPKQVFAQAKRVRELWLDVPQMTEIAHGLRELGIPIRDDILTIEEMVGEICRLRQRKWLVKYVD